MSSFYAKHEPVKPPAKQPHLYQNKGAQSHASGYPAPHDDLHATPTSSTHTNNGAVNMTVNSVSTCNTANARLPPLRRIVKLTLSPTQTSAVVSVCAFLNTVLHFTIPSHISHVLGTQWGSFLYFWLLVTLTQLVSQSVYLCTPVAVCTSLVHLFVIVTLTAFPMWSLFVHYLWLVPCLCAVITVHQTTMFCLVYSSLKHQWMYAVVASAFVLVPSTQLLQTDPAETETLTPSVVCSVVSICTMYLFAFVNSRGGVIVDITIGQTPGWLQE